MGGHHSRLEGSPPPPDEDGQGPCRPCFFMDRFAKNMRKDRVRVLDPMGTPLPETPLFQRKRRQEVHQALKKDDPVYSSKYGGLDKEVSSYLAPALNGFTVREEAHVHEGLNAEAELHAKYQLLEVLGIGSTCTVYRCLNKASGEQFACKVIDCLVVEERFQGMMSQFLTEVEALQKLHHPGIIRLYDVYIPGEKIYIVMEYMDGGELFDYVVQKGTLTEEEASGIVRKVTNALVFVHEKNIVHRGESPWT
jgi:serine/threonine protein kinase